MKGLITYMYHVSNDLCNNIRVPLYMAQSTKGTDVFGNQWQVDNGLHQCLGNCKVLFVSRNESTIQCMSFAEALKRGDLSVLRSSLAFNKDFAITPSLRKLKYASWIDHYVIEYCYDLSNGNLTVYTWYDFIVYFTTQCL